MVVESEGIGDEPEVIHALRGLLRDLAEVRVVNDLDRVQRRGHELVVLFLALFPSQLTVFMLFPPQIAGVVSFSRDAASSTLFSLIFFSGQSQFMPSLSHTSNSHIHGSFR